MDLESSVKEGLDILLPLMTNGKVTIPKMEQIDAMCSLLKGFDTTCCLPTGWGKSMIFFALPAVYNFVNGKVTGNFRTVAGSPVVVVTSPLVSLMTTHTHEAKAMGINAVHLPDPECDIDNTDILFGSAEYWTSFAGLELLRKVRDRVLVLAVDEVHVAPKWGTKENAFRLAYGRIRDLRSFLPEVPILALTATASRKSRMLFQRHLSMANIRSIVRNPDRGNIFLTVNKVKDSDCLLPVVEELRVKKLATPRTIIYCKSVKDCTEVYQRFDKTLGQEGYVSDKQESSCCLFAMFFHDTIDAKKERILEDLMIDEGHYRVVIALGMGVNIVNCNRIIHYGVPRDLEDYMQEIGRAGRSGEEAEAKLFYRPVQLLGCNEEIKDFVKNTSKCRRALIVQSFAPTTETSITSKSRCCDVCCVDAVSTSEKSVPRQVREVLDEDKQLLSELLEILKKQVGNKRYAFGVPVFSPKLIDGMMEHLEYIDSIDYIAMNLPVMDVQLAIELFRIICEVFDEPFQYTLACEASGTWGDSYLETLLANVDFDEDFSDDEFVDASHEQSDIDSD